MAEDLVNKGYTVIILDDLSGGVLENIPKGAKFIEGSVNDYELLKKLFDKEKFDYVYHLAAYAAESLSHNIRRFNYENNLIGSVNLINLSIIHKIKCFVFTSSVAVYGHKKPPLKENSVTIPTDPYGIAKYAVELDLHSAYRNFGLNSIIFRPHNVFGERQNINDKYRNVIGIFINQLLNGKPITIFGDGEQSRAFTYIKDISSIMADSVLNPKAYNKVFNIGGTENLTVNALLDMTVELMNISSYEKKYLKVRNEAKHNLASDELIKRYFNVENHTPIKVGLQKMIEWVYASNRVKKELPLKDVEVPINLPEGW